MAGVSAARRAAFRILLAVELSQSHADDLLRGDAVSALAPPDRHLTTAMVLGVLRWQILLDERLRQFLTRPHAKLDSEVLIALRLGAFQLLHLDRIPTHAAIDESVELTRQAGHRFASRMVNAVLRKLDASRPYSSEKIETRAHPAWMVARWSASFGPDAACAICRFNQSPPTSTIRLATPGIEQELTRDGIVLAPGELLTAARIVASGDVTTAAAFREGRARIQDEGSQLVAEIASAGALGPKPERILDCCAAPGGKTLILAERQPEAQIVACEIKSARLEALRKRLAPFASRILCQLADATALGFVSEFDIALADVPCSGTGTLNRNPEIRHRLRLDDLPRHAERQRAILLSALCAVRPGGRVVYSTCSLEPEENEQVIAPALAGNKDAQIVPFPPLLDTLRERGVLTAQSTERLRSCVTTEGFLRLIPGAFGTDGFFVAIIEKKN